MPILLASRRSTLKASSKHTCNCLPHFVQRGGKPSAHAFVDLPAVDQETSVLELASALIDMAQTTGGTLSQLAENVVFLVWDCRCCCEFIAGLARFREVKVPPIFVAMCLSQISHAINLCCES